MCKLICIRVPWKCSLITQPVPVCAGPQGEGCFLTSSPVVLLLWFPQLEDAAAVLSRSLWSREAIPSQIQHYTPRLAASCSIPSRSAGPGLFQELPFPPVPAQSEDTKPTLDSVAPGEQNRCSTTSATQVSLRDLLSGGFGYQKKGWQVCRALVVSLATGCSREKPEAWSASRTRARVQHFSPGSSILNLVQFLRAFRRKSRACGEAEHGSKKSYCCNNKKQRKRP